MKINRLIVAVSILVLIFGGVLLSRELGWWKIRSSGSGSGKSIIETSSEDKGESEEEKDESEEHEEEEESAISGSTTVQQVLDMGVSQEDIISVLGEYDSADQLIKDIAEINGLSFGKVKTSLEEMIGG